MSSSTPNLNLVLPVGSEHVSRAIINENNTKIDTGFGTLSEQIAKIPSSTTCNSLDAVKTYLNSVVGTMADNDIKTVHILTGSNFTGGYFKSNIRYSGHIIRYASTQFSFVLTSREADYISGGMITSTWTFSSLSEQITPYGKSQWVGNVTSIDALNALTTPGRYLRYISIANVGLPSGWVVVDVSALNGYDNYIQVVTYPETGVTYTRQHPTNGTWGNFNSQNTVTKESISTSTGTWPSEITLQGASFVQKVGRVCRIHLNLKIVSSTKKSLNISGAIPAGYRPIVEVQFVTGDGETDGLAQPVVIGTDGRISLWNTKTGTTYAQGDAMYIV